MYYLGIVMAPKQCKNCSRNFSVAPEDKAFYEKMSVPEPTFCPQCRSQKRLSFRNEINLYTRKCDFTGKDIISMYSPDKAYKIYDQEVWWSDKWDPYMYGRDFDFNKPFFEQFVDLQKYVPRMSLNCIGNENSYFANYALRNKNSYLIFTADFNEDSYYGRFSDKNFHSCDFDFTFDSTYCYETVDMYGGNACMFSQKCHGSSDLFFCYNMRNCHSCIFCANLRNKDHYILNKQVSKEEFEKFKKDLNLGSYAQLQKALKKMQEFLNTQPRKYLEIVQCENSLGDYLQSSKNAKICFDSYNLEDVAFASHLYNAKDCYDWDFVANKSELCYEMVSCAHQLFNCRFCMNCWDGDYDLTYCDLCLSTRKCFGCIGLRKGKYCILNKEYSEEEYEKLMLKIIEHMKRTGEFGEFFPENASPFCYNESVASEYFPLQKEEALKRNLHWKDKDKKEFKKQTYVIPDNVKDVPDSILEEVLACENCGKNFKIVKQELAFYKETAFPIPHLCFNCRHKRRMSLRNPRILYDRTCVKCKVQIKTTYQKTNPAPIYCEKCYLEFVD